MVWFKSCKNVTLSTFLLSQNVLWGKYKISIKWWWNKYLQNNITDECFTFHWYYRNYIMQICMNLGSFIASSLYGWHMKVFRYRIVIDKFTLLLHFQSNDEDNTWFMDIYLHVDLIFASRRLNQIGNVLIIISEVKHA